MNDVMIRNCNTGEFLLEINLFSIPPARCEGVYRFTDHFYSALLFENEDEAQATIDFISNVIDFEIAECLEIVIVP